MKFLNILIIFSFFFLNLFFYTNSRYQPLTTSFNEWKVRSEKWEVRSGNWHKKKKQTSKNKNKNKNQNKNTLTPTATQTETETTMRYLPLGKRRWDWIRSVKGYSNSKKVNKSSGKQKKTKQNKTKTNKKQQQHLIVSN